MDVRERIVVLKAGDGHSAHFVDLLVGLGQDFGVLKETKDTRCDGSDRL